MQMPINAFLPIPIVSACPDIEESSTTVSLRCFLARVSAFFAGPEILRCLMSSPAFRYFAIHESDLKVRGRNSMLAF